jgi:very-short-patch-repair endonuclease
MELLLLLIPVAFFFAVYLLRGDRPFSAPRVSPISDQTLSAVEAAPSLWVNRAEATFFAILTRHLPRDLHLHGKVRLEDIIRVRGDVSGETRWKLRGRVKSRHVDYVVTDRTGRPVLAIELDGYVHDAKNPSESDKVKTALFMAAGIPLRRICVGENFDHIAATIGAELKLH